MDIRLPGESGLELTKRIKASHPEIAIINLTAGKDGVMGFWKRKLKEKEK
jgi:DNA-binding NarL/FixJ family response regulator